MSLSPFNSEVLRMSQDDQQNLRRNGALEVTYPLSFWTFLIAFMLTSFSGVSYSEDAKFKVGVIAPLSGPAHIYGDAIKNGITLAARDLGEKLQIKFIFEDDEFTPAKSVSAYRKLVNEDKVDAIVVTASQPSNAIAPLANAQNMTLFSWASDERVAIGRPNVLRLWVGGGYEGGLAADEALRLGYKKIAAVISSNDFPLSVLRGFKEKIPSANLVLSEEFLPGTTDFKSLIIRAIQKETDGFFICLNPGLSGVFAKQVRELHSKAPIFSCMNLEDNSEIAIAQGALNEGWLVSSSVTHDFHTKLFNTYKTDSVASGSAVAYDLVQSLHEIVTAKDFKFGMRYGGTEMVAKFLAMGKREGAVGKYQYTRVDDDRFTLIPMSIRSIADGKLGEVVRVVEK